MPIIGVTYSGVSLVHSLSARLLMPLVVLLPALLMPVAQAGQKIDIYKVDVLVKNQSESERNAAARLSFGELIVRVTGQRSAVDHPVIRQALPKAQNYLFGFTYKATSEKIVEGGKSLPALALQLNYEPRAIDQLLREAQLPLWPAVRPKVLVWLIYKDANGLHQVPQVADLQGMNRQANFRGLPLAYPKLDLEDSLSLTADDLWAVDVAKIKAASLRYKTDAILVGRYTPTDLGPIPAPLVSSEDSDDDAKPVISDTSNAASDSPDSVVPAGPWVGDWQLIHGNEQQAFADETPEVSGLFASAVDRAADYFANQYAITPTNQGPQAIALRIGNITSFGDFKQAQRYLGELAMVQRLEVVSVDASGLLVRVTTEGDSRLLASTLALGRRLTPLQSDSLVDVMTQAVIADPNSSDSVAAAENGLDANAMAELDQALANEQLSSADNPSLATDNPVGSAPLAQGGTMSDPLIYVWQK